MYSKSSLGNRFDPSKVFTLHRFPFRMCFILIFTAHLALGQNHATARSEMTSEQVAIHAIQVALEAFEVEHPGQKATNWSQIGSYVDLAKLDEQTLVNSPALPIQDHYSFALIEIPMLGYQEGNVVLIRNEAVKYSQGDEEREGRYIISRNQGILKSTWMAETNVQKMFAAAGITELPNIPRYVESPKTQSTASNTSTIPIAPVASLTVSNRSEGWGETEPVLSTQTTEIRANVYTNALIADSTASDRLDAAPGKNWLTIGVVVGVGGMLLFLLVRRKAQRKSDN